jgi:WD40 repeat protein
MSLAFAPDGSKLAIGATDGLHVWPVDPSSTELPYKVYDDFDTSFAAVAFSGDGRYVTGIVSSSIRENGLVVRASVDGRDVRTWRPTVIPGSLQIDPSGRFVATHVHEVLEAPYVMIWDAERGSQVDVRLENGFAKAFGFGPDGRLLIQHGSAFSWTDPTSGALVSVGWDAQQAFLLADSRTLVWQDSVGTWRVGDASQVNASALPVEGTLPKNWTMEAGLGCIAFEEEQGTISVRSWLSDAVWRFAGDQEVITAIALDPSGRWLATSAVDGTVVLWPLNFDPSLNGSIDQVLARLRNLTSMRAVADTSQPAGYGIDLGWLQNPPQQL